MSLERQRSPKVEWGIIPKRGLLSSEFCCLPFCLSRLIIDVQYSSSGSTKSVEGKSPLDLEIAVENIPADGSLQTSSVVEGPMEDSAETNQIVDSKSHE
jgi:hypothetical protein